MSIDRHRCLIVALCVGCAALLLGCGWLVPMHLRAVDESVLQRAGENGASLIDRGLALERAHNPGAARLLLEAAQTENLSRTGELAAALAAHRGSEALYPGGPEATNSSPVTAAVLRLANRERVLSRLEGDGSPAVLELLRARELTNTVIFPASSSSAGQAFDAAISIAGLLLAGNHLAPGLRDAVVERAAIARTQADAQPLEDVLMDFLSLGQRLSWSQLLAFVSGIDDPSTLSLLASQSRSAGAQLPTLFAAVVLSQKPNQVAAYLNDFEQTGLHDLGASLPYGEGGLDELLLRHQRLYASPVRGQWATSGAVAALLRIAAQCSLRAPWLALAAKWLSYLAGGFLLASAFHYSLSAPADIEAPVRVHGYHRVRELLFAMGFLLVILLLSEPFLAQESQKAAFAFRLRLPLSGATAANSTPLAKTKLMETRSLLTMLLFFVLQGLIYCACLIKLAEIRRQKAPPRLQLRLLENEEHLFDGGLYLGFAGTIICLILVSLGIIQQSLMAAYSSTSFGIIFVSIFKIFNLRPARRNLLMHSEAQSSPAEAPDAHAPTLAPVA